MGSDPLTLLVDSRVRFSTVTLDKDTIAEIKAAFAHRNPAYYKLKAMGYKTFKEKAIINTWKHEGGVMSIPRGGFRTLRTILRRRGVEFVVRDHRCMGNPTYAGRIPNYQGHQLRDYQIAARDSMVKAQNTIIRSGTGSGKTSALLAFAAEVKLPTLVVVWMGGLYEQWIRRIGEELGLSTKDIGEIRGTTRKFGPITVAMQQTLWGRLDEEITSYPGVLIVDEVHRAAAKTLREIVDAFPAYYRVGASDDERRADQKEFLIYDAFGQPTQDIKYDSLADQGHVVDVDVICVMTDYVPPIEYFDEMNFNVLLEDMVKNPKRNAMAMQIAKAATDAGEQVFVMSHRVQHCIDLNRMLNDAGVKSGLLVGAPEYKEEFQKSLLGMETGGLQVGVGTVQAIGTGLDLPDVSVAVVTTPIASNESTFRQARGRICRVAKGKDSATMYYLMDPLYGKKHVRNLCKWSRRVSIVVEGRVLPAETWLRQG